MPRAVGDPVPFGRRLRRLRSAAGLTQQALAERSGLSVGAIGALESGRRRRPRTETVAMLAGALGLTAGERNALEAAARAQGWPRARGAPPALHVPRELPRSPSDFTGRFDELAALLGPPDRQDAPTVLTITGMAGVGKSALAIQAAHQLARAFPDGNLYVNLQGATAGLSPLTPLEALGRMLRSLGMDASAIPDGVEEASARFLSLVAERRLLLLLDDAHSAEQVRPLLPASPGCRVLVTSRHVLTTLEGARALRLDVLPRDQALELLDRIAGPERIAPERRAAGEVVRWCGRLPLAIRIAGARLASRTTWSVERLAGHLADARRRLEALEVGDLAVRASFHVSLQGLEESRDPIDRDAAAAFGLLGLLDGPDLSLIAAAHLIDRREPAARSLLERLIDAQLLESPRPDRYRFHDLVRLYAREHVVRCHPADECLTAIARAAGFYTATAWHTLGVLRPGDRRLATADPRWTRGGLEFPSPVAALQWLEAERINLLAGIAQTADVVVAGSAEMPAELPCQLARALFGFFNTRGHMHDLARANATALRVARHVHDPAGRASALNDLGLAYDNLGRHAEATACHEEALAIFRELGDRHGQAGSLNNLGLAFYEAQYDEAIVVLRESLGIFRELDDRRGQASSLNNLGYAYARLGRNEEAIASLEEGLTVFRELGARLGEANSLNVLGIVYSRMERYAEAIACHRQSLDIHRALDARLGEAQALKGLGVVLSRLGQHAEAIAHLREAVSILREISARREEAQALQDLGDAIHAAGAAERARR